MSKRITTKFTRGVIARNRSKNFNKWRGTESNVLRSNSESWKFFLGPYLSVGRRTNCSVRINYMSPDSCIVLGLDTAVPKDQILYGYKSEDGNCIQNKKEGKYGEPFGKGDVITIYFVHISGVYFLKNGVELGKAVNYISSNNFFLTMACKGDLEVELVDSNTIKTMGKVEYNDYKERENWLLNNTRFINGQKISNFKIYSNNDKESEFFLSKHFLLDSDLYEEKILNNDELCINSEIKLSEEDTRKKLFRLFFGWKEKKIFKNLEDIIETFEFCHLLKLNKYCFVIFREVEYLEFSDIIRLFILCTKKFEKDINESRKQFNSLLTSFVFNKIKANQKEILSNSCDLENTISAKDKNYLISILRNYNYQPFVEKRKLLKFWNRYSNFYQLYNDLLPILYNNTKFSDVVLKTNDGREYFANKIILMFESDYFFKVLKFCGNEFKDNVLEVKNLNNFQLEYILKFIYHVNNEKKMDQYELKNKLTNLFKLLGELYPYGDDYFIEEIEQYLLSTTYEICSDREKCHACHILLLLERIGYLFHDDSFIYPKRAKDFFLLSWKNRCNFFELSKKIELSFFRETMKNKIDSIELKTNWKMEIMAKSLKEQEIKTDKIKKMLEALTKIVSEFPK